MHVHDRTFNNFKIHTQYSICEGAIKIDDLAEYCKANKIKSLGLADSFNLCGAFEFAEKLRENKDWLDIPVVVITAKDLTKEDHNRLKGNVEAIMQKGSYSRQDLLTEVGSRIKKIKEGV